MTIYRGKLSSVLICAPYRIATHPALLAQWRANAALAQGPYPYPICESFLLPDAALPEDSDGRFSTHARARNRVLAAVDLARYDYLLWVDVDIVRWPADLLTFALTYNPDGITAPAATLDRYDNRFYDTLGFIEYGQSARLYPPWFDQAGPIIELESVGMCYLAPTALYRDGARYDDTPGKTEHWSVMQEARRQGRRIIANLSMRAIHAYLPDYGEALH